MNAFTRLVAVFLVMVSSVLPLAAQDPVADEFRKLQGAWVVSIGERSGKPIDGIKGGTLTIADRAFSLRTASGNTLAGELRLDPSKSPRQLDFVHANGVVWQAIYTLDGDAFKLNYVEVDGREQRPRLFATSADTPGSIIVMRRKQD